MTKVEEWVSSEYRVSRRREAGRKDSPTRELMCVFARLKQALAKAVLV